MKTLQLMAKMQSDLEEKQKRKKLRQQQKRAALLARNSPLSKSSGEIAEKSPATKTAAATDRKFLSSIMNTLFSSSTGGEASGASKGEAKRLSLRRLKERGKQRRREDEELEEESGGDVGDETRKSSHSLHLSCEPEMGNRLQFDLWQAILIW